jgi:hypothetical protein
MLAGPFSSSESAPATVLEWSLSFLMIMARFSQEVPSFHMGVASVKSREASVAPPAPRHSAPVILLLVLALAPSLSATVETVRVIFTVCW